jgi:hypothetical protein
LALHNTCNVIRTSSWVAQMIYWIRDDNLWFFEWLFQPIQGPGLLFSSIIIFHRQQNSWISDQPTARPLPKHTTIMNAHTHQTSKPWVGFEPTTLASEWAKTVYALDGAAIVTGWGWFMIRLSNKGKQWWKC